MPWYIKLTFSHYSVNILQSMLQRSLITYEGNKNATSHIIQAISTTVQRGNVTSIMGTLGPLRKLKDFFDVISPREEES